MNNRDPCLEMDVSYFWKIGGGKERSHGAHEAGVSRRIMRSGGRRGVEREGLEKMKGADPERDPRTQLSHRASHRMVNS